MTAPYTAGTIDLVSGSATVVGTDTAWEVSLIIGGTIYVEFDGGNPMPIATVDNDTEITAALKWTGPTGTYSYAIVRDTAYGQQTVANAQALATYIQRLNNPALAATAGVTPSADKMLLFTGPNSATVIDLADVLGGDFNGPEGGVAENDFVVFADGTGKLGKKAPPNSIPNSLLAQVPSGTFKGRASAGDGSSEDLSPAQARKIIGGWEPIGDTVSLIGVGQAIWTDLSPFVSLMLSVEGRANTGATSGILLAQVSTDNGASWAAGASDYPYFALSQESTSVTGYGTTSNPFMALTRESMSLASLFLLSFRIGNFNKASPAMFESRAAYNKVAGENRQDIHAGYYGGSSVKNAFRVACTGGAFATGTAQLIGLRG
ncbi:hypothetical protein [Agrobacterium tumefaciens]|uniref:hypothetical protein n=1 Tax=Agrobacterium tumefaciens TaxID=358 RepID=UPI0021D2DCD2|nr:hypothetical protein [Agrobacterium tumefaciens]